jgi:phosphatidylglycerophosphate synthase
VQALFVLPPIDDSESAESWYGRLCQNVAGVPLVVRVLATAAHGGVTSVLVVRTSATPDWWIRKHLQSPSIRELPVQIIGVEPQFDPNDADSWSLLAPRLEPTFLWLPWNYVTLRRSLAALITSNVNRSGAMRGAVSGPAVVVTNVMLTECRGRLVDYLHDSASSGVDVAELMGVAVSSAASRREAERLLVRGSGKPSDGIYSNFNRRLCRPAVRWLANTPVTANAVTMFGLLVTIVSAYWYAQGYWSAYVIGALLYFLSVLLDEVDGMLARTKFQDSPFGTWLETVTDYASYLFLWAGMSLGLSRQFHTPVWLELGALTAVMSVLIFIVLLHQRRIATSPDRPDQFHNRFEGNLDADAGNPISAGIRKISFLAKKGVMAHYVVLFSALGLLPVFVGLAAFGSVLTLAIVLYANRRFFRAPARHTAVGR